MSHKNTFYITTTLPYVNSDPHIGFAMEIVRADSIARYQKMLGKDVFFNTGTDEHGSKIYEKALENKMSPKEYTDMLAIRFEELISGLNILSDINFIRTTDEHHIRSAQAFWKKCVDAGDIYKKNYQVKYCVGCELEKTDSELVEGKCPLHPTRDIEHRDEENYFFAFSKYQKKLLELYEKNPHFVIPSFRLNEIKSFVERGLQDFSISRLKEKMPWGVPVPEDDTQVMYVWFDALVNYISAIGWPHNMEQFNNYWPVVQYAGKDNLRQQSAMWQAMLMSAGIEPSAQIIINGFINGEGGVKMSKSLGNVVSPFDITEEYGIDALRYFLVREISAFEDSEFTADRFKDAYNANLANGLGNLMSRTMKMAITYGVDIPALNLSFDIMSDHHTDFRNMVESYDHQKAMDLIWLKVGELDKYITETEPYKKIKTDEVSAKGDVAHVVRGLYEIGSLLAIYMPDTSKKMLSSITTATFPESLFVRKD